MPICVPVCGGLARTSETQAALTAARADAALVPVLREELRSTAGSAGAVAALRSELDAAARALAEARAGAERDRVRAHERGAAGASQR